MRCVFAQQHASAPGAFLAHEVNPHEGGVADGCACSVAQVAQHAAPRVLALHRSAALQPAAAANKRMARENRLGQLSVAQARQEQRGCGGVESAGAGGACIERNLVYQIWEGTLGERLEHWKSRLQEGGCSVVFCCPGPGPAGPNNVTQRMLASAR